MGFCKFNIELFNLEEKNNIKLYCYRIYLIYIIEKYLYYFKNYILYLFIKLIKYIL